MSVAEILARARHVLLDFDGPVCAIYGGTSDRAVADRLREVLRTFTHDLPAAVASSSDPLDVLRYSAQLGPDRVRRVEAEFIHQETMAVATATETPGSREAITALTRSGHTVTMVSNNSAQAVKAYLARAGLTGLVSGVVGRVPAAPELMKPQPHLLLAAMAQRGAYPGECVMVGDSISDVEAARAAGTTVVAYANKASKRARFEPFRPDAIIEAMHELTSTTP